MAKHPVRTVMEEAIREVVVLDLRARGFRGSFPHFRRPAPDRIDLVTFQFYSSGGSFVVELAICPVGGVVHSWGKAVPPNKVTAHDVSLRRRLGSGGHGDHWFVFGKRNYEPDHKVVGRPEDYLKIAREVRRLLGTEAEAYWEGAAGGRLALGEERQESSA